MSSEQHHADPAAGTPTVHTDVSFESKDVNTTTILAYLFYLAIAVGLAFVVSIFIFRFTNKMASDSETPMPPVHRGVGATIPPEPHLQGVPYDNPDPQQDLREKIAKDIQANQTLTWIDKSSGIAQIPVEDAMKIIVSKGLPGAAAPAEKKK